ncbi:MAG TPA: hypothetical protein VEA44_12950 [Caulobacter sp.]|nr:hypothetical protein [Caulobacter sp.]
MAEISSTDAGLVGFNLARSHPMVIPAWAILDLISSVVIVTLLISLAGPALMEAQNFQPGADLDAARVAEVYGRLAPAGLLVIPLSLFFGGILYAGASRLVLRPEDRGFGWLKLGGDEFRQMLLLLVIGLIFMLAYLAVGVVVGLVAGLGAVASPQIGILLAVLGGLLGIGFLIWLAVRLSLASPATFALGRLAIGESWRLTKGRFWSLLWAYVLAIIMAIIVGAAAMALFFVVAGIPFGFANAGAAIMSPDMTSMATMFTGVGIAYFIWSAVVSGLTNLIFLTPAPTLYAQLKGDAEVFD